jgi:hypothetical protein
MRKTTIEFSDAASDALHRLAEELFTTKAEVLRNALTLYDFIVDELSTGGKQLGILDEESTTTKVILVPGLVKRRATGVSARSASG